MLLAPLLEEGFSVPDTDEKLYRMHDSSLSTPGVHGVTIHNVAAENISPDQRASVGCACSSRDMPVSASFFCKTPIDYACCMLFSLTSGYITLWLCCCFIMVHALLRCVLVHSLGDHHKTNAVCRADHGAEHTYNQYSSSSCCAQHTFTTFTTFKHSHSTSLPLLLCATGYVCILFNTIHISTSAAICCARNVVETTVY